MKILPLVVLLFIGCNTKKSPAIIAPHCIIFRYMGEINKPIPTLYFCDSTWSVFNDSYFYKNIVTADLLNKLSTCIPRTSDVISEDTHPLYEITSVYDSSQNIINITSAKGLQQFINCTEKYVSEDSFYIAYQVLEFVKPRNP